ncbi:efflux RND transporter permease subunit [Prosthecobacter sp.]|uniref:efflux RND transporter permease subunit n=1 Tax=Prosthecobacter sp. TaxID=1965333 RepID=UPI003782E65E
MIDALITWSVRNRFVVVCATLCVIAFGIKALRETAVDAIPDLSERQVIVFADWMGRSPQEVEDQVTHPLSVNLQGIAGVKTVRATSMFGFSLVTVIFEDAVESFVARQRISERLDLLELPAGVKAKLGPDATGLGWVYQYYLDVDPAAGHTYDLGELRSLQDYHIRYQLNSVAGVAEVGSVGGFVRQYQIEVDSQEMRAAGVSLNMVMMAVGRSNLNVGGKTIEENGMEFVVRGIGLIKSAEDLEKIVLMEKGGTPVYLKDVARIEIGGDFRRGTLDSNGHEIVGGMVVMHNGANAREVIGRVKAKIAQIAPSLPPGVSIKAFYDRSELIDRTIDTLRTALTEEIILVILAHIIFLFHFRSILIVTLPLPISLLISFILMKECGFSSNLMSLSGIAIAIGVLVDAAIVITENVIRKCEQAGGHSTEVILGAAKQVGRPIVFAMGIIILAFVPVFALSGQEGKLFHPLAYAKTCALLGATLLAVTLVPVLCTLLVRGPFHAEDRNVVMRFLLRLYDPALNYALHHRKAVLGIAAVILAAALALVPRMGSEFMPPLNEGSLMLMPSFVPATSLSEVKRAMAWQDQVLAGFPEVRSAVGKLGRADTATDPAPTEMIETTIMLKPENEWRAGMTKDKLVAEMMQALRNVPGSVPGFLQPIEGRVLMISTGIRSQLGVKIFGNDLGILQQAAQEVQRIVQMVPGATGVTPSRIIGKPYLNIEVDREATARMGMNAQDVLEVVEAGLGGATVTTVIEGRQRVPVQVRLQRSEREDITRLRDVLVTAPNGRVIPLGQLASINRMEGPNEIASENGRLRSFVQANVSGRDLAGFVEEVKARLQSEIAPRLAAQGMTLDYSGEYEQQLHAARTLKVIVPAVLLIIFLLLYQLYGAVRDAAHVLLAVPFALSGGVFLQYALGQNFSVAVWVGYIALLGTAVQTAVVMVVYLEEAVVRAKPKSRAELIAAVKEGARLRLRPKIMTVATIIASLLPIMWSHRAGSEVMQPLATPIIGGMVSSLIHILIVTPVIYLWLKDSTPNEAGT